MFSTLKIVVSRSALIALVGCVAADAGGPATGQHPQSVSTQVAEGSETALRMLHVSNDDALLGAVPGMPPDAVAEVNQARPAGGYSTLAQLDAVPLTGLTFFSSLERHVGLCADGLVQAEFEECDDGNTIDKGDACTNRCEFPLGPSGQWAGDVVGTARQVVGQVTFTSRHKVTLNNDVSVGFSTCFVRGGYMRWWTTPSFYLQSPTLVRSQNGRVLPGTYDVVVAVSHNCPVALTPELSYHYDASLTSEPDASRCGDGRVDGDLQEACDDGNNVSGDACNADCTWPAVRCGNLVVDPGEECDGNEYPRFPDRTWRCNAQCKFDEREDIDPGQQPNYTHRNTITIGNSTRTEFSTPVAFYLRAAHGVLYPGDVDRLQFHAVEAKNSYNRVDTYALRGHLEMDCRAASVAYVVRQPLPYQAPFWPVDRSPRCWAAGICSYQAALVDGDGPRTAETTGSEGMFLRSSTTRYAGHGVCAAREFMLEPLFCLQGGVGSDTHCYWPTLDIVADDAWDVRSPASAPNVPWRFVVDELLPRAVQIQRLW